MERKGLLHVGGSDVTIIGSDIEVGQAAPEFRAQTQDWSFVDVLDTTRGKVRIITALPSLNTSVCDAETRRFNQEAGSLDKDIAIVAVSTDLPYTLKNWCAAAGVEKVMVVSDHYDTNFGEKYGVLIKERRILRRAVFVVEDAVARPAGRSQIGGSVGPPGAACGPKAFVNTRPEQP